jgi:general secretion pathway protein D
MSGLPNWRLRFRSALSVSIAMCMAGVLLSACILTADQSIESDPNDPRAQDVAERIRGIDLTPRGQTAEPNRGIGTQQASKPAIYLSDGKDRGGGAAPRDEAASGTGEGFDLNFENAPVTTVAKVILSDILGVGYSIDPRVQGTVSLSSGRPIAKADALFVLENALRMSSVALVRDRKGYRLVPAADAVGSGEVDRADQTQPGYGMSVVPLRFVSSQNVFKLLDAFGVKASTVRADPSRNLLVVQGTGAERRTAIDTIMSFDADWMKGQSVGIIPVRNSSPEPVIAELEKILDSGEGGLSQNVIKLQPIARLNSILVVSLKPEYLKRTATWIARLDRSDTEGDNLKVYPLRHGSARQITALLNEIISGRGGGGGSLDSASSQIAPGTGLSVSSSGGLGGGSSGGLGGGGLGGGGLGGGGSGLGGNSPIGGLGGGGGGGNLNLGAGGNQGAAGARTGSLTGQTGARVPEAGSSLGSFGASGTNTANAALQNVRITADVLNNSVLVYGNQEAQRIVEQTLRQIDRPQRQVAIEATIAEVTLNDSLNYGVQFFVTSQNLGLGTDKGSLVNTLGTAALNRVLPGFNLLVGSEATPRVVLDALHGITDVKVLSNPSLVVMDNQVATLQVGDQVPISTGSATVLTTSNTIVNTIDYRNTGIILRVQPRSNASGNVVLDIEQEISNVGSSQQGVQGTATTLTPTISQRRVKSTIAVNSGQTVLLAGLISEQQNKTRSGIPVLDSIPGVGDAFAHQNNTKVRTELILFIRPTVIRDSVDAQVVAEELRTKFNGRHVGTNLPVPVRDAPNVRR